MPHMQRRRVAVCEESELKRNESVLTPLESACAFGGICIFSVCAIAALFIGGAKRRRIFSPCKRGIDAQRAFGKSMRIFAEKR